MVDVMVLTTWQASALLLIVTAVVICMLSRRK